MGSQDFPIARYTLPLTPEIVATQRNIREQMRLIARLMPGTKDHELATRILFLLQDSMHALASAYLAQEQADRILKKRRQQKE